MALFLTIVLALSCFGMVALLWAKHWELSTGRLLFAQWRPGLTAASHRFFSTVKSHLPALMREGLERLARDMRYGARAGLARTALAAEGWLERSLHNLRHATSPHGKAGEASAFLREVAEHKKQLTAQLRSEEVVAE